jgi:hypothetical protein
MPLIKSKSPKAFSKNVETEMNSGKDQKQALAIAYNVKRSAGKKKYAKGGEVRAGSEKPTADSGQTHKCTYMCNNQKHYNQDGEMVRADNKPTADSGEHTVSHPSSPHHTESMLKAGTVRPSADRENDEAAPHRTPAKDMNLVRAGSERPTADKDEHGQTKMADGGYLEGEDTSTHMGTLAEAIAKRLAKHMMAEGGRVDLEENSEEHGNAEDDLSFEALGKEQYDDSQLEDQPKDSNEHEPSHEEMDVEDKSMRSKISKRSRK